MCAEAGAGRVVHINGGVSEAVGGLKEPQGLLLDGDDLYIVDAGAHELVCFSTKTRQRETVAANLPVGAPLGVMPKPLLGIPGLLPGPLPRLPVSRRFQRDDLCRGRRRRQHPCLDSRLG